WPRAAYEAALEPDSARLRIALVAEAVAEEMLAGFAVASVLAPEAELETIAVAPAWQRQGVARQLLAALLGALARAGAQELRLEVRASNLPALALYRAAGFREAGRRPRYYANPEEDALLLRLEFGAG
ncbi:MAG: ribosomal protein S18-alanine N-acetyltransferase, partial [Terracidiphilus sp.]